MKPLSYNIKALRDLKTLVCLYAEMHTVCDSGKTDVALRICWPCHSHALIRFRTVANGSA